MKAGQSRYEFLGWCAEGSVVELPFAGAGIACGFPSPADDFLEDAMDFNKRFIRNPSASFWVRATGECLTGIGIFPGSYLLIDRSIAPRTGHVAACWVDGAFTGKVLRIERDVIWLMPANDAFEPIRLTGENEFSILGIVSVIVTPAPNVWAH